MENRLDNLGDYNKMRLDLQKMSGNLAGLYEKIGNTAVVKAAPKLMFAGGAIAIGGAIILGGTSFAGYKYIQFMKDRKSKIKNEPFLKKRFEGMARDEPIISDNVSKNRDLKEME